MKYKLIRTNQFRKDFRAIEKKEFEIPRLIETIKKLENGEPLPKECRDHGFGDAWTGYRACYIEADWLLIYLIDEETRTLALVRTGRRSDLFKNEYRR